jgi:hypothetical protein
MPYANPADKARHNRTHYRAKRAEILAQQKQYKHACRAVSGDMTPAQWAAIVSLFGHCCARKGQKTPCEWRGAGMWAAACACGCRVRAA